jgi:hypothetical protein
MSNTITAILIVSGILAIICLMLALDQRLEEKTGKNLVNWLITLFVLALLIGGGAKMMAFGETSTASYALGFSVRGLALILLGGVIILIMWRRRSKR